MIREGFFFDVLELELSFCKEWQFLAQHDRSLREYVHISLDFSQEHRYSAMMKMMLSSSKFSMIQLTSYHWLFRQLWENHSIWRSKTPLIIVDKSIVLLPSPLILQQSCIVSRQMVEILRRVLLCHKPSLRMFYVSVESILDWPRKKKRKMNIFK